MKSVVNLPIENISPFTLLDYPDQTACILWFAGCNMKCHYCYNPEIVYSKGRITYEKALEFLKTRIGLLDGVVFSGGECTIQKGFVGFLKQVRQLGFKIKIDTNGSAPWVLSELLSLGLIDFVALDFKSPKNKYFEVTQSKLFDRFEKSLNLLVNSGITFEVRTTFHENFLTLDDLKRMSNYLINNRYTAHYYIQHFVNNTKTISEVSNNYMQLDESVLELDQLFVKIR